MLPSFNIDDFVPRTGRVLLPFKASDIDDPSTIENAIDDIVVAARTHITPPPCQGDVNNDGQTNVSDFNFIASNYGLGPGATPAQGDLNGDGFIDVSDCNIVAGGYGCGAP